MVPQWLPPGTTMDSPSVLSPLPEPHVFGYEGGGFYFEVRAVTHGEPDVVVDKFLGYVVGVDVYLQHVNDVVILDFLI